MSYGRDEFVREFSVSRETAERLETHLRLLRDWSQRMNLMGPKELDNYWDRHARDCAQLVRLAPDAKRWVDLGSGAGFPGLIVAALLADVEGAEIHLVESIGKKANFLRESATEMNVPVQVFNVRIEDFTAAQKREGGRYDVVTARALAPLPRLIEHAKPILDRGAQGLFHKGANADAELAAATGALNAGRYRADVLESLSDPSGRIIRITKIGAD